MGHRCHAIGCTEPTPPSLFMCRRHWFLLPKRLRNRIWATYRPGQEVVTKTPSREYLAAAREARAWLRQHESSSSLTGVSS
jgi:hypothetical protein